MENEEKIVKNLSSETAQEMDETAEIENMKKVEAALFLSARFLSLQELVMLTDINPLMLRELMEKLIERYNSDNSAIEIIVKEDMWKMDVGQEYVSMINKLATGNAEFSKAEQETLAVIAYKQPVKQSVIINIRGNKAYDHIKHFTDISLVQSKKLGRTKELKLSDDFFEYFHLQKKGDGSTEVIEVDKVGEESEEIEEAEGAESETQESSEE
ncbi:MAG: SMC-Scp complex subunit ScpB [Candidatus Pacearchaeota archaeon]|jgi:segregation and condensation protein B